MFLHHCSDYSIACDNIYSIYIYTHTCIIYIYILYPSLTHPKARLSRTGGPGTLEVGGARGGPPLPR